MQILDDHMTRLSFLTNEVIVSRARSSRKLRNSVTEIIEQLNYKHPSR